MRQQALLLTAAMWCIVIAASAQHQKKRTEFSRDIYSDAAEFQPSWSAEGSEEYELEMARLPQLMVFTNSEDGFEKIIKEFPTARQINILDAKGDAIYRYLPSLAGAGGPTYWPKGLYYIEWLSDTESKISEKRIIIL